MAMFVLPFCKPLSYRNHADGKGTKIFVQMQVFGLIFRRMNEDF